MVEEIMYDRDGEEESSQAQKMVVRAAKELMRKSDECLIGRQIQFW